jgi:hypothetical protein
MALEKELEFRGIMLKYHKIVNFQINFITNQAEVLIVSYANEDVRRKDVQSAIVNELVTIKCDELDRKMAYEAIKHTDKWREARDV